RHFGLPARIIVADPPFGVKSLWSNSSRPGGFTATRPARRAKRRFCGRPGAPGARGIRREEKAKILSSAGRHRYNEDPVCGPREPARRSLVRCRASTSFRFTEKFELATKFPSLSLRKPCIEETSQIVVKMTPDAAGSRKLCFFAFLTHDCHRKPT